MINGESAAKELQVPEVDQIEEKHEQILDT